MYLSLLCVALNGARGEEPATELPEVVVTATRTRVRAEDATTSVSVVTANDLTTRDEDSVADALRPVPGMDVTQFGSPGHSAFVSIRGSAPDEVLVLLDGCRGEYAHRRPI